MSDANQNQMFDLIVVGAGPAGSTLAAAVARAGYSVALLEEHYQVGRPDHCSGLVSPRTLEAAGIDEDAVALARYDRARIWGPQGGQVWVQSTRVQAVAIDRPRFDQTLAARAVDAGATLMLGTRARQFERSRWPKGVRVEVEGADGGQRQWLRGRMLAGAEGAGSGVARWMGARGGCEMIAADKAVIAFDGGGTETIEVFVGRAVAPGWFGWVIPLPDGRARIGVGAKRLDRDLFDRFCDTLAEHFSFTIETQRRAPISLGPPGDFVGDRVLLVGAAAGQTKPTTGGGIYLGVRAAQLAAETAIAALARDDLSAAALAAYEQAWQQAEGREVAAAHWLRQVFRQMSDHKLDAVVRLCGTPWAQRLITRLGDIDYPGQLLSAVGGKVPGVPRQDEMAGTRAAVDRRAAVAR